MGSKISVVIPARDEAHSIGRLLDSLLAQTRVPDEVIVVDGGSRDRTVEIVQDYIARGAPIRLICTDRANPGQARNLGVSHARGDVIVFWDGGMAPQEDSLEHLVNPIVHGGADVSHGRLIVLPAGFVDRCYNLALIPGWNTEQNGFRFNAHPVANSAIRKALWKSAGGFRPWRAGEDFEFRERVGTLSARVAYDPDAVTVFRPDERFGGLVRKLAVYSRHNLLAARAKHWQLGLARIYGVVLLGAVTLAILTHISFILTFLLLSVFQLSLRTARNAWRKRRYLSFSPWGLSTFLGALFLLFCADLATWAGLLMWLFGDRLRLAPEAFREPSILFAVPEGKA